MFSVVCSLCVQLWQHNLHTYVAIHVLYIYIQTHTHTQVSRLGERREILWTDSITRTSTWIHTLNSPDSTEHIITRAQAPAPPRHTIMIRRQRPHTDHSRCRWACHRTPAPSITITMGCTRRGRRKTHRTTRPSHRHANCTRPQRTPNRTPSTTVPPAARNPIARREAPTRTATRR